MKKAILSVLLASCTTGLYAQWSAEADTVSLGAGYADQVWYSLENDEQARAAKNEWDIAVNLKDFTATIHINSVNGVELWNYPGGDITAWNSVDTNGLSSWAKRYNTDTSWAYGAIGRNADLANWDVDWGIYDMTTHKITGDSLFIVKLGNDYKLFAMDSLIKGVFYFRFADLDGSNTVSRTIKKSDYTDKLFAYYSLRNDAPLDREPKNEDWDLLFTQYTDMDMTFMSVTGVLQNVGVLAVKVDNVPDVEAYSDYGNHQYRVEMNTIGWDNWKTYDFPTNSYTVEDSLLYLVSTADGDYWKVIFTGFDNTTGEIAFNKHKLFSTSVKDLRGEDIASMAIYPNPVVGAKVHVMYQLNETVNNSTLTVYDMQGRAVYTSTLSDSRGTQQIPTNNLAAGNYIVVLQAENARMQQHLVIR